MDFKMELNEYKTYIEQELEKYIKKENCPEKRLNEAIEYSLMSGGKRIRPTLVFATYKLFKQDIEKCNSYAIAIEMIHNFSLIHDDLPGIDNDDFRHGKPTNHKKFNEATAILAGDSLLNEVYIVISKDLQNETDLDELNKKIKIFNEFSFSVDKMIIGEYVDTEFEGKQISSEYLEYTHQNKTGALIKLAVRMGAILGGATIEELENLTNYAEKIGLAFQIKDDILSVEGNEKITGKPVGNDEEKAKSTYVSKYGLDKAKQILENTINQAILCLKEYDKKADFLKNLAYYIKDRNK